MKWIWYYFLFQICLLLLFWIFSKRKDRRYKANNDDLSKDFEPTQEVFIDPISKVLIRVYVNRKNGERRYIEEKGEE
ncbi:UNVERIFIED_ORG: elongation factor P hydroxylase [Peribacillus simplex]